MRFQSTDPDIETIVNRIQRKEYDLQPDFQRGEVWSRPKKQRLIDSILRKWHVPPIHVVARADGDFDVLDGQQRLTAIRDFVSGEFAVDGRIEPANKEIQALDGLRFERLPDNVKKDFRGFSVRLLELHDYTASEPHELFFRLNQPTSLTEAEKRNAFVGDSRNQVRAVVEWASEQGLSAGRIGFSNARMGYDDLVARVMLTIERGALTSKITAGQITARYRDNSAFSQQVVDRMRASLEFVLNLEFLDESGRDKPNKATMHTWLCMAASLHQRGVLEENTECLSRIVENIEKSRLSRSDSNPSVQIPLQVFNDRATSRVADTSSVILRDLSAWMLASRLELPMAALPPTFRDLKSAWNSVEASKDPEKDLFAYAVTTKWGAPVWL